MSWRPRNQAFWRDSAHRSTDDQRTGRSKSRVGEVYLIGAGPWRSRICSRFARFSCSSRPTSFSTTGWCLDGVLDRARRDAQRVFVGKETGGDHHATQARIHELLVQYAKRGLRVARLKGGDPFIFGRGGEEIEALQRATASRTLSSRASPRRLALPLRPSIPLTHRRLAQSVTFAAGHALDDDTLDWRSLGLPHHTVVFYMGVAQMPRIVSRLTGAGASPDHPAALIERGSLADQRVIRGTLGTIVELASALQRTTACPADRRRSGLARQRR